MTIENDDRELQIKMFPKQWVLLKAFYDTKISEILYGWSWRCWKTWGVSEIVNMTCCEMPGIVWAIWRKEWDDLRKTSLNTLMKVFRWHGMERYRDYDINLQTKELVYANGSKILFIPLKSQPSDMEYNWLWSYEITYARVDEAQEVERKSIDILKTRQTEMVAEYDIVPKIILTCNPMKWHLYNDFIKPNKEGRLKKDRIFIPASYKDNPYLDHEKYEKQYENADKITKERILYWNWEYDNTPWRLFAYDSILDIRTNPKVNGRKCITCDVAREWKDKTVIRVRDWFEVIERIEIAKSWLDVVWNKLLELSQKYKIPMRDIVVDEDWVGGWVVDYLKCSWFVNNSSPIDTRTEQQKYDWLPKPNYANLKTQCTFMFANEVAKWTIRDTELTDEAIEELDVIVQVDIDKDSKLKIISKAEVKEKLWRSPDDSDCMIMRMFLEIKVEEQPAILFL